MLVGLSQNLPHKFFYMSNSNSGVNNNLVSFKSNPTDSVELSPKKSGTNTAYKVATTAFLATFLAAGADLVFAKGKHIKKLFGMGEKKV